VLLREELPRGEHSASWDGRDDSGLRVGGGTYFVKLTAGDITQTRKVVFLGGK
jgi:flagellar hook assembly protein FlgD